MKINEKCGLPIYLESFYPKQEEIALMHGFLPHYMLGFSYEDKFFVNPYVFHTMDTYEALNKYSSKDKRRIIRRFGLDVDQSNFEELIAKKTNYKHTFTLYDGFCYCT
ncbi:MAG: hypothetical protein M0P12_13180 [Paludibacteraceae bacterium]|nr:hypothetical protein [Paludibacteraceae bacterium]